MYDTKGTIKKHYRKKKSITMIQKRFTEKPHPIKTIQRKKKVEQHEPKQNEEN